VDNILSASELLMVASRPEPITWTKILQTIMAQELKLEAG